MTMFFPAAAEVIVMALLCDDCTDQDQVYNWSKEWELAVADFLKY